MGRKIFSILNNEKSESLELQYRNGIEIKKDFIAFKCKINEDCHFNTYFHKNIVKNILL